LHHAALEGLFATVGELTVCIWWRNTVWGQRSLQCYCLGCDSVIGWV